MRVETKFRRVTSGVSKKAVALALAFTMCMPSSVYANAEGDYEGNANYEEGVSEDEAKNNNLQSLLDEAVKRGVPNAFMKHKFLELENLNYEVDLKENEEKPVLKINRYETNDVEGGFEVKNVDTGILARTKFDIGEFDFGKLKTGRMIYEIYGFRNSNGNLNFYFGDNEEPFATRKIKRCSNEKWQGLTNIADDVRKANLSGKEHIYVQFIADNAIDENSQLVEKTGKKTSLFLRSMFFTEGSTPVLDFDLDDLSTMNDVNGSFKHEIYASGEMNINIPEGYKNEYTKKELKDSTCKLEYLRGRGNSTWECSKKPYKIKLDKSTDLFGMGKNKHWVLLANYYDYTLIRNRYTFYLAKELGLNYTPKSVCVDVVIGDEYYGSYQLTQQIRVGKTRVEIDDLEEDYATTEPDITGGYLINMGGSWKKQEDEDGLVEGVSIDSTNHTFILESPEYDDDYPVEAKDAQIEYISKYFATVDTLVKDLLPKDENQDDEEVSEEDLEEYYNSVGKKYYKREELNIPEGATWRDYMDEQSLIDYYFIQEFSANGDAYGSGSTYLYKTRDGKDGTKGKLYWGPVWDFDFVAWNAVDKTDECPGFGMVNMAPWFYELLTNDEKFKENVKARWDVYAEILKDSAKDGGMLDKMADETYMSALANYQIAESVLSDSSSSEGFVLNYYNEINRLKSYVNKRVDWINEHYDEMGTYGESKYVEIEIPFYNQKYDALSTEYVKPYAYARGYRDEYTAYIDVDTIPAPPEKPGYEFDKWCYINAEGVECEVELDGNVLMEVDENFSYIPAFYPTYVLKVEKKEIESMNFLRDTIYIPMGQYIDDEDDYAVGQVDNLDENYEEPVEYRTESFSLRSLLCVAPVDADTSKIKWEIVDENGNPLDDEAQSESIIFTDADGNLEVYTVGEAYVKASYGKLSTILKVVAIDSSEQVYPNSISADKQLKLSIGQTANVNAKFNVEENIAYYSYSDIGYKIADSSIATVDGKGMVTGLKAGETKVYIYYDFGEEFEIIETKIIVTDSSKKDVVKKAPKKGTKLSDKTFTYKVTKKAANNGKKAGEVTVVNMYNKKAKKVTVKSVVKIGGYKYKVTSISKKAFKGAKKLTKITIGKNVKKIGEKAFYDLKKLTKVTIKSSKLPKIGKKAFIKKGKKKITIKVKAKLKKKAKKALKKAKCKGYIVK